MKHIYAKYSFSFCNKISASSSYSVDAKYVNQAVGGRKNFEKDFAASHIDTSWFQKFILGLGSGFVSITDPRRGDMVAVMGESTGARAFEYVRSKMLQSPEGKKILEDKPRISSASVDLERLKQMPEGTLGRSYSNFLERYKYSPDSRLAVRFVDDFETAYVAQRYREAHDLFHTILDMPTNMLGEVTVKWVEAIQTRLPMCVTGALFGPLRLSPKLSRGYGTKVQVTIDPEVLEGISSKKVSPKKTVGKVTISRVKLPVVFESAIHKILKLKNAVYLQHMISGSSKYLYNRQLPFEEYGKLKYEQVAKAVEESASNLNSKMSYEALNKVITKRITKSMNSVKYLSQILNMANRDCLMYLITRAPYEYSALLRIFTEISVKDADFKPKTLFDFGSGVGTVTWAASSVWKNSLVEYYSIDNNKYMNEIAAFIINPNNEEPVVKTVYQRCFFPSDEIQYDIVVSAFTLLSLENRQSRLEKILSLWNKTYNYLVLVENGTKHGFHVINEARDAILNGSKGQMFRYHVSAPCPHHMPCPSLSDDSPSCIFPTAYTELKFGKSETHNDLKYSYVVFKKGDRPVTDPQWPRIVREVLPKHRHVICRMCTNEGKLERVIFTKNKYGKETYQCAKYSKWGDIFPAQVYSVKTSDDDDDDDAPSDD